MRRQSSWSSATLVRWSPACTPKWTLFSGMRGSLPEEGSGASGRPERHEERQLEASSTELVDGFAEPGQQAFPILGFEQPVVRRGAHEVQVLVTLENLGAGVGPAADLVPSGRLVGIAD